VLTNYTFIAHHGLIPLQDKNFAAVFMLLPIRRGEVRLPTSYEMTATVMGSPSTIRCRRASTKRCDLHHGQGAGAWENVFVYGDIEKPTTSFRAPVSCALCRACCTRLAVKLDFICGCC